jgi:hypothetical protein
MPAEHACIAVGRCSWLWLRFETGVCRVEVRGELDMDESATSGARELQRVFGSER